MQQTLFRLPIPFSSRGLGLALVLAAGLSAPAGAQCLTPDNLSNGSCWEPVDADLPAFPSFSMQGLGICWDFCDVTTTNCTQVQFTAPVQVNCAQYTSDVTVLDCAGAPILRGQALLDYTRTWAEISTAPAPAGGDLQVWRMVAKIDFQVLGAGGVLPCPVPTCLPVMQTAFYYGYVDWARNCATGNFTNALTLFHSCDRFIHDPALSDRPGFFHPTSMYGLVAPSTAANPFVPMPVAQPSGPLVAEAVRNTTNPFGIATCVTEERISSGNLINLIDGCLCPLSLAPPLQHAVFYDGVGSCPDATGVPSSFSSLNFFGLVPWFFMTSTSIGAWTTDATYPGKEAVLVQEGLFSYHDSCAPQPGAPGANFVEIQYGAQTTDGFLTFPLTTGAPLTQRFNDMASNFSHQTGLGVPVSPPILGSVRKTDHLIYTNTP